ncbi:MAG: 16S rRNA (uracil(1498)-N(3))-methyltransferase [Methylobacteriaceae bacterium]|nr:16S rRNA (uracil(1498)-N(3))-methyltransferase [Methylobacteriaceae bacterium]
MPRYDFSSHRLHVDAPLAPGKHIDLTHGQANYLTNVLRLGEAATVLVFNGRDGEWTARIAIVSRKAARLVVETPTRPQPRAADLDYLFAPLKHARLDYMVQKAVEMGASRLVPVITRRTQVGRLNRERMQANVIEAAEQCGILAVPEVLEARPLERALAAWSPDRLAVFCDEDADVRDPVAALSAYGQGSGELGAAQPVALIIGPEGGFDPDEREALLRLPRVARLSLGPRILRADTAAVAALALIQAVLGDGRA